MRRLFDSALFWLSLGAAVTVVGGIFVTVGAARTPVRESVLSDGWFDAGIAVVAIGVGLLFWSLVLFLAHQHAERHIVSARSVSHVSAHSPTAAPASPFVRLKQLQDKVPTLQGVVENAYGEKALLEARQQILAWCLRIEKELQSQDEKLWTSFREGNSPPGMSDRTAPTEGMFDPERQWDHIDSRGLFGFLRHRADALGYALAQLTERSSGEQHGALGGEPTRQLGEDRQVGVEPDPADASDAEGE
jgi:hypothetical protein